MFRLIITTTNGQQEEYKTRGLTKAYKMYDNAIRQGYYVNSFTNPEGKDMQDRQDEQSAIVYQPAE